MTLVSWWPLHSDSGDAIDIRGGNDGTVNGATQGVTGLVGNTAYYFNGTSDNGIQLPNLVSAGSNYTVTLWFKSTDSPSDIWESCLYASGHTNDHDELQINPIEAGSFDGSQPSVTYNANDGSWHHVSVANENGTHYVYLDGVEQGTFTNSLSSDNGVKDGIGGRVSTSTNDSTYVDGTIAEVRFYNHALSPNEVQYLYDVVAGESNLTTQFKSV